MEIDFEDFLDIINEKFHAFFFSTSRIRISYGGGGSGKSVEAFQECIYKLITEPGHNYLICRKVAATNKTSTYSLFQQLIYNLSLNMDDSIPNVDVSKYFKVNKTDLSITCKLNGNMVVFKGLDDIEKIKSITFPNGVLTDIIIEEASEVTQKDFNQLNVRLRGKAKVPFQITMLLNPINDQHWIKKEFIDLKSYQKKYKVFILKTTYKDNIFIDDDYKDVLEGYKEIDYEFYRVYCLGEWGSFGNVIFTNWTSMKCPYREEDFDAIYVGQDYGFEHPSIIVKIGFKDGNMYSYNELCCEKKTNIEFIQLNQEFDVLHKGERAIGDSAEPARIKEWVQHGYGIIGAKKGPGSVGRGIDFIKSQRWFIDPDACPRTLQEAQVYHRKTDKNGNVRVNEDPVDLFDDAMKAHMYALEPLSRSQGKPSVLSGSKSDAKKGLIEIKRQERKKIREAVKDKRKQQREQEKAIEQKQPQRKII
jgi:phage terminase large subunit